MVMPEAMIRAAVTVSLMWGWPLFAATLLLGFHGLLRPGEFLYLTREELILPRDLLTSTQLAFVRITDGKTRRFMRRQHARISDHKTVMFLDALFGHLPPGASLFNCSREVHRTRWNAVFSHLHVATSEADKGVIPKTLRGSGATWLYQRTEDVEKIQWRGRWQQRKTLEYYLQDVAGQLLLAKLTQSQRLQVMRLASFSEAVLDCFLKAPRARCSGSASGDSYVT